MIPSVNPDERDILLPYGCKDLIDELRLQRPAVADPVLTFIQQAVRRAERVRASQIIISPPTVNDADCDVMQRVNWEFRFDTAIPASFRSQLIARLLELAAVPEGHFPAEGLLHLPPTPSRLTWRLEMESAEADCVLLPDREA